ncbi:hypothetical protein FB451DRAFT_1365923 [Mycena latifolia]|nr:hypothetical protein FB451DRAFT_1365923 [Mycena latifolia]
MIVLVQDLIDTIIDEVGPTSWTAPKDLATLKACSLVARSFQERSQHHIFRSLRLMPPGVALLSQGLCESPHLASYIRALHLIDGAFYNDSDRAPLASLFPLLSKLTHLAISSPFIDWEWNTIPVDFRAILVGLLSLPSLRSFALAQCWGVPSSIIRHALVSFKEVSLKDVGVYADDNVFPHDQIKADSLGPLDHLAVHYTQQSEMSTAVHALILEEKVVHRMEGLRLLEVWIGQKDKSLGALGMVALKASDSLRHLVIRFGYGADHPIPLPHLPHLRFLTFRSKFQTLWVPSCVLAAITNLPTCMPDIEVVNILIDRAINWKDEVPDSCFYPEVDAAMNNLPRLREVNFSFGFIYHPPSDFEATMQQRLPLASEAGLLVFSQRPRRRESPFSN